MSALTPHAGASPSPGTVGASGVEDEPGPRPRLFVSNVTLRRPADARFDGAVSMLFDNFVRVAALTWDVTWAYANQDGAASTVRRGLAADAVVILGGEDVSPELYGAKGGYPREGRHWIGADRAQIGLAQAAVDNDIPLLGICRGIQVLAVALGGSLVADLDVPGHRSETFLDDHRLVRHDVVVDPGSRLSHAIATVDGTVSVPSAHHQAVATTGPDLRTVAVAPDGTIEAVEHRSAPVYGVQWHPEDPAAERSALTSLLDHLRPRRPVRSRAAA